MQNHKQVLDDEMEFDCKVEACSSTESKRVDEKMVDGNNQNSWQDECVLNENGNMNSIESIQNWIRERNPYNNCFFPFVNARCHYASTEKNSWLVLMKSPVSNLEVIDRETLQK